MMNFLAPKGLRAEVTEGIDLEHGVMLTGDRVTVGSGPGDDLKLGAADIVHGHLTFERRADGSGWDYFSSDRGVTVVDRGNPRTGQVRPGMSIRLGRETQIELIRAPLPATPAGAKDDQVPTTVPMPVALGLLGGIAALAVFVMVGLGGGDTQSLSLRTTPYLSGSDAITSALETCLATPRTPNRTVDAEDPASPYWQVMAFRGTDPARATAAQANLVEAIREILTSTHLLSRENRALEASGNLRRLEYVLPVGTADCPILAASRFDLALLELRGSR